MMKKFLAGVAMLLSFNAFAAGDIEAGRQAVEKHNCFSCHGKDYNSPIDPSYPKLAGQHQDYLVAALTGYKRGANGPNGRGNAIMGAQVQPLSHEDVQNIAAYLHSLPGSLVLRK